MRVHQWSEDTAQHSDHLGQRLSCFHALALHTACREPPQDIENGSVPTTDLPSTRTRSAASPQTTSPAPWTLIPSHIEMTAAATATAVKLAAHRFLQEAEEADDEEMRSRQYRWNYQWKCPIWRGHDSGRFKKALSLHGSSPSSITSSPKQSHQPQALPLLPLTGRWACLPRNSTRNCTPRLANQCRRTSKRKYARRRSRSGRTQARARSCVRELRSGWKINTRQGKSGVLPPSPCTHFLLVLFSLLFLSFAPFHFTSTPLRRQTRHICPSLRFSWDSRTVVTMYTHICGTNDTTSDWWWSWWMGWRLHRQYHYTTTPPPCFRDRRPGPPPEPSCIPEAHPTSLPSRLAGCGRTPDCQLVR